MEHEDHYFAYPLLHENQPSLIHYCVPAFGAWVVDNIEFLTNIVGQALILTTTGILAAFHLSIGFALTSVALLLDFSSNGNGLTILLTITWNRIVGALKLK